MQGTSALPAHRRRKFGAILAAAAVAVGGLLVPAPATAAAEGAAVAGTPLITTADTTWSYLEDNTDPAGTNANPAIWTTTDFPQTNWKSGKGAFGAKNGLATGIGANFPVNTLLTQYIPGTTTDVPTFFFRTSFDLTAAQVAEISGLAATVVYDDGVVIYLNGAKVAGLDDSRVTQNLQYAGSGQSDPQTATAQISSSGLKVGKNTVSVALYQDRASSSDIYLNFVSLVPTVTVPEPVTTISDLNLHVGSTQAERNLAWYSSTDTAQVAQLAETASVVGGVFPASATSFAATGGPTTSGEYNRFATVTGLKENTSYTYRVGAAGNWSPSYTFRTRSFSGDFDFLFFGDPQIGSSGNVAGDAAGWADTLNVATASYPNAEMLFSSGDQVETATNEPQYAAFLQSDLLRQIPFVATNGNHDVGSKAYEQHFNTPNTDRTAGPGTGTAAGGDYWYIYKDVLFLNINSNSRNFTSHINWMRQVIADHGAKAKWKMLAFHHSIYSPGPHATDSDVLDRRNNLPTVISELGIDLVLQGHDHSYARTYLIKNGQKADPAEIAGADTVTAGPGGVLYLTANSASGSKYYDLQTSGFWWLSAANQEKVRNYTAIEVTDTSLKVKTLRSQANGTAKPVNSLVDQVTLRREKKTTTTDLTLDQTTAKAGTDLTATVKVTTDYPALTGTVTITNNGAVIATTPVTSTTGTTTVTVPLTGLPTGATTLTAAYSGNDVLAGSTSTPTPVNLYYTDYPPTGQFYTDVQWLAGTGITTGYTDGTFRPGAPVERQAITAFLYRQANPGTTPPACTTKPYTDIPTTHPFCAEITWAKNTGITTGYPDGTFHPADKIQRQAIAAFLYRANNPHTTPPPCTTKPFTDITTTHPFCAEITWAKNTGITNGFDNNTYRPLATTDRQTTAAFLHRTTQH
ncbi:metallophosphoesterase [Nakamurella silvestris]|nr:metallophosphoesterase [Nakamurella silvestris]